MCIFSGDVPEQLHHPPSLFLSPFTFQLRTSIFKGNFCLYCFVYLDLPFGNCIFAFSKRITIWEMVFFPLSSAVWMVNLHEHKLSTCGLYCYDPNSPDSISDYTVSSCVHVSCCSPADTVQHFTANDNPKGSWSRVKNG